MKKALGMISLIAIIGIVGTSTIIYSQNQALINKLNQTPEIVAIESRTYVLDSYLWRDYMPIVPEGGRPLYIFLNVSNIELLEFPTNVKLTRLWLIKDNLVWKRYLNNEPQTRENNYIFLTIHDGPKWNVGDLIDAIIELFDGSTTYLLKQTKIPIDVTY